MNAISYPLHPFLLFLNRFPYLSCILCGIIGGYAFAPVKSFLFLIFAFSGFLLSLRNTKTLKKGFLQGWCFGFGYFLLNTYWISISFHMVGLTALVPFVAIGLASLLAFFPACVGCITVWLQKTPLQQVIIFSTLWSIFECIRGLIFPWNFVGYVWDLPVLQLSAFIGIKGLSIITIWTACVFVCFSRKIIAFSLGLIFLFYILGGIRLQNSRENALTNIYIRIVQPCIFQTEKWDPMCYENNIKRYIDLSGKSSKYPLDAIIWPEAAIPFIDHSNLSLVTQNLSANGIFVTGTICREKKEKVYNCLLVFDCKNNLINHYYKANLVPFGEYVPLKPLFFFFEKLTHGVIDFSPGPGAVSIKSKNIPPFSPLICYEAIFSGYSKKTSSWLLNITNDAWFGNTNGPLQHLEIARVRSIEEGLPMIRVANNGISAIIDPYGKIEKRLSLNEIGVIDFFLPTELKATFYKNYSDFLNIVMIVFLLTLLLMNDLMCDVKKRKNSNHNRTTS
ncbi:MAG: apolipoprotein N-acyltransferase [Alphaproteobacteria bacterium]